jgi:imidazoleglycerol phosphate synthase glutamine amidotransferase subunit HisH
MGFNKLKVIKPSPLLTRIEDKAFYFMHSYEVINYTNIVSLTSYAGHEFVSCMQKNNIYGVQFHPEKSRDAGIQLFKNFINIEK